jgi:hypothetical protein
MEKDFEKWNLEKKRLQDEPMRLFTMHERFGGVLSELMLVLSRTGLVMNFAVPC